MRVLHVVTLVDDDNTLGGPLTVAINQCTELRRRGHDARLLGGWVGSGSPPSSVEGVPAHLFKVRNLLPQMRVSALFSGPLLGWLRSNAASVDVAHLHLARDLVPLLAGEILGRMFVPYVTQTHGMVLPDDRLSAKAVDRAMTLRVLRGARARLYLTAAERGALASLLGHDVSLTHLANGVSVTASRPPRSPLDVLFMARLHPRKRVLDFAQAARALIEAGHDATFSIVGPDDGELPLLREFLSHNPTLADRLRYEGPLPHHEAVERLSEAGIFVLPSVDEPFPMTLLEALALGIPSICTTGCGLADALRLDRAAIVVEPGAVKVTEAIRGLLGNTEQRLLIGKSAEASARRRYSTTAVGNELEKLYGAPMEALL